MAEPRAKNRYGVHYSRWSRWSEAERHCFNKLYDFACLNPQRMQGETWPDTCMAFALIATDIQHRSKDLKYWKQSTIRNRLKRIQDEETAVR